MARENNAMSADELRAFIATIEWVALATLDASGAPSGSVAPAVLEGDRLYFAVAPGSVAEANLARDPRCSCTADVFPSYYEIRGATLHGKAGRVEASAAIRGELGRRAMQHGLAAGAVYSIPLLEDSFGFDFGKLERR